MTQSSKTVRGRYRVGNYQIDPDRVLAAARAEPPKKPKTHTLAGYARAAEVLRRKGFTWQEVADWLTVQGVDVGRAGSIGTAVRLWWKTDDYMEFCAEEDKEAELAKVSEESAE